MFSSDNDLCRTCIIDIYEEEIGDLTESIDSGSLRHLNVVHTEIRNRIVKDQEDN